MKAGATVVVLGVGQIGSLVARQAVAQGYTVRQVRRSGQAGLKEGIELRVGDLSVPSFAAECAQGADAIIHCVVPPYHQWNELLEPLNAGVLHAATTSGARLVVLDNLYGYGKPTGPMTETSPVAPISRKGELRARIAGSLLKAHQAGTAKVAIARASDFYGPGVTLAAVFGDRFIQRALKGQAGECFGDPQLPHSYSYADDVAAGLLTLAKSEQAFGEVWHLPVAPAESTGATIERFGAALGVKLGVTTVPKLILRAMGLFSPPVREMLEMLYQWEVPFVLSDAKFQAAFKTPATPLSVGVPRMVEWMKQLPKR